MSIVTKTGDKGTTSLYFGGRIRKDDPRVEFYGTIDEACSFLGMSKNLIKDKKVKKLIEEIQRDLFVIGAEAATKYRFVKKLKKRISGSYVKRLEGIIKDLEGKNMFKECCFYIPGEDLLSSTLDVTRTVVRRAERKAVTLRNKKILRNQYILIYLNRLSDLLYLLSRAYEKKHRKLNLR